MADDQNALAELLAKDQIRELVLLYSRGVSRRDGALLRSLYTADATDTHGDTFDGGAEDYVRFLEARFPHMRYSGYHVCNHLISVRGADAEGEVYTLGCYLAPDTRGGWLEGTLCVRYFDRYRKEADGRWRFAKRVSSYDYLSTRPARGEVPLSDPLADASYQFLSHRLFKRGARP